MKIKHDFITNSSTCCFLLKNPSKKDIEICAEWAHIKKMVEPYRIEEKDKPYANWLFYFSDDTEFSLCKFERDEIMKSLEQGDVYYMVSMDASNQGFLDHYLIEVANYYNGP